MKDISNVLVDTTFHSERVALITELLVELAIENNMVLKYSKNTIKNLALLHDIGKYLIPPSILTKTKPLTSEEWEEIRMHPILSHDILKQAGFSQGKCNIVLCHHERLDGSGYPYGVTDIPIESQIIAVADVYDALTNPRIYRKFAYSHNDAIMEMQKEGLNTEIIKLLDSAYENNLLLLNTKVG